MDQQVVVPFRSRHSGLALADDRFVSKLYAQPANDVPLRSSIFTLEEALLAVREVALELRAMGADHIELVHREEPVEAAADKFIRSVR